MGKYLRWLVQHFPAVMAVQAVMAVEVGKQEREGREGVRAHALGRRLLSTHPLVVRAEAQGVAQVVRLAHQNRAWRVAVAGEVVLV